MLNWLNAKRIRDYPRLVLTASWAVVMINIVFSHGMVGGLTGILMWGDYIDYYSAGQLYISDIGHLYDPAVQEMTQLSLLAPSKPSGFTFYSYPPNTALVHSLLTYIPLNWAIAIWCIFSIGCVFLSAYLLKRYLISSNTLMSGLSTVQLSILLFSSFAFIEGFAAGQTHSLTLLLIIAILISTKQEKWLLAGILATVSTFKPQFAIGFLILWLLWGKWKAIISFAISFSIWQGIVLLTKGVQPYLAYFAFSNQMMFLPYAKDGFPISIMATPFSLIASIMPVQFGARWNTVYMALVVLSVILYSIYIFRRRKLPMGEQNIPLALAVLLPVLITPYVLLHDLLVLAPVLILLASVSIQTSDLKFLAIVVYISLLFLPLLGYLLQIALTALIPVGVTIYCLRQPDQLRRYKSA